MGHVCQVVECCLVTAETQRYTPVMFYLFILQMNNFIVAKCHVGMVESVVTHMTGGHIQVHTSVNAMMDILEPTVKWVSF